MLKINKKVEYALMALKHLADHNAFLNENEKSDPPLISAREICDQYGTPFDTMAKVMQIMNAHDLLKSVKGIKGGYYLNKNLSNISYIELVRMIEGRDELLRVCQSHKGMCELFSKCNIITPVEQLNKKLSQFLDTLSLEELLNGTEFNLAGDDHCSSADPEIDNKKISSEAL